MKFLKNVKQQTLEKLNEILINTNDITDELFLVMILSNYKCYHQNIINECLKFLEESLLIRFKFLRVTPFQNQSKSEEFQSFSYQYLCQKKSLENDFIETRYFFILFLIICRVAVIGNVDAGKSTLLGVLSLDCLDDGRGSARLRVFQHPHEANTGRTSSVGTVVVGFDENGNIVKRNHVSSHNKDKTYSKEICKKSNKVINYFNKHYF